ncbi:MAG: toll/interleukin-1 receptor domain-containing protein [Anaerohalosphaera sp.]|nr:toll/interleukin-1 receptor domain-containing protein [Anaerohalosphaera sp.]
MKVFISWSGDISKKLAEELQTWLNGIIQAVTPYVSSQDIEKGELWDANITQELSDTNIGILCLTRDNLTAPWILFEAGAIAKSAKNARVCPILFGALKKTDLNLPLSRYQGIYFNEKEIKELLVTINSAIEKSSGPQQSLPTATLDMLFKTLWPQLEEKVAEIIKASTVAGPTEPVRSQQDTLDEMLTLLRKMSSDSERNNSGTSKVNSRKFERFTGKVVVDFDRLVKSMDLEDYGNNYDKIHQMRKDLRMLVKYLGSDGLAEIISVSNYPSRENVRNQIATKVFEDEDEDNNLEL